MSAIQIWVERKNRNIEGNKPALVMSLNWFLALNFDRRKAHTRALNRAINHPDNTKYKILIVEDEAITALDLQEKIEGFGYEVVSTENNGENAIEIAKKQRPDLILMDIS